MRFLSCLILCFLFSSSGFSQDIDMTPIEDSDSHDLINGQPLAQADYPVTVYSRQGNSRCTANVVGERVLIIAAHCVGDGRTATFSLPDGQSYTSTCAHNPGYDGNATYDWALCLIDRKIVGYSAEMILTDQAKLSIGQTIMLSGYGCTSGNGGGSGGNDGTLRGGNSTIRQLPSGSSADIVTEGNAALCFGDSGGPAWVTLDGKRYQVSVNSRGDIRTTSYLSSLTHPQFKTWAMSWSQANAQKICGLHADASGCRGGDGGGGHLPEWCLNEFRKFETCLFGNPRLAISQPQDCRSFWNMLFTCEVIAERDDDAE